MKILKSLIISLLLVFVSVHAYAELWTGVIDEYRATDWADAGADIVDYETACTTSACNRIWCGINTAGTSVCDAYPNGQDSTSITAANINTAISGAPDSTVVRLPACTRTMSTGLSLNRDNVILRGLGADQTILNFGTTISCAYETMICVGGGVYADIYGTPPQTSWTDGYTKGTEDITVSSASSITVGNLVFLAENQDSSDGGYYYVSGSPAGWAYGDRRQLQVSEVTAKNGNVVTIDPPVIGPDYVSGKSPIAYWSSSVAKKGIGIEDLRINNTSSNESANNITMTWVKDCWVKGITSTYAGKGHVTTFQTVHVTLKDSFFYGSQAYDSQNYGIQPQASTLMLIENNIFQRITSGVVFNGGNPGAVIAYNYMLRMDFSGGDWWGGIANHDAGSDYVLFEGNYNPAARTDDINGTHNTNTFYRNFWSGNDPTKAWSPTTGTPIIIEDTSRIFNIIGNVLGTNSIHTTYGSIYDICSTCSASLMRWGNYDTGTDTVRWESSEVPSEIAQFANAVPSDHTLPPSMYLSSKPDFFGDVTWPPIGPDVTGGDVTGWDGYVNEIPAKICFDGLSTGGDGIKILDADECYPTVAVPANAIQGVTIN